MERRLILMRHAKSAWDTEAPNDHARPLSGRGRADAPKVAARLAALGWVPELVLSSDAVRTRETWARMASAFRSPEVRWSRRLYGAGVGAVQDEVATVGAAVGTVLLLGHNPGWEGVLAFLSGRSLELTTANAALLRVDAHGWPDALERAGAWELVELIRPKSL